MECEQEIENISCVEPEVTEGCYRDPLLFWNDLGYLPDKQVLSDDECGYITEKKEHACTVECLADIVEHNGDVKGVWLPGYDKIVPPEFVECLYEASQKRKYELMKKALKSNFNNFILWGIVTGVFYSIGAGTLLTLPAFFCIFNGLIPAVQNKYSLRKLKNFCPDRFEQDAYSARFHYWVSSQSNKLTVCMAVCLILVTIIQMCVGPDLSIERAGLVKSATLSGEYWRIFTGPMLHGGLWHIGFNVLALLYFGRYLLNLTNYCYFLVTFNISAIVGSLFSLLLMPDTNSVGASGGILGMLGFLVVLSIKKRDIIPNDYRNSNLISVVIIALLGVLGYEIIDNAAHAGGLLAGALLGVVLPLAIGKPLPDKNSKVLHIVGAISAISFACCIAFTISVLIG